MFSFLPEMIAGFIGAYFYNHAQEKNIPIRLVFVTYFFMVMLMNTFFYLTSQNRQPFWLFALGSSLVAATFCATVMYILRTCKGRTIKGKLNK